MISTVWQKLKYSYYTLYDIHFYLARSIFVHKVQGVAILVMFLGVPE